MALTAAIGALADEINEDMSCTLVNDGLERNKQGNIGRKWSKLVVVTQFHYDSEFNTAIRMRRSTFRMPLSCVQLFLLRNQAMACRSSGCAVQPEIHRAITLRMLAGGSCTDQMMCWRPDVP